MENYNEIHAYGISLVRLTEDKIEMVRQYRNDPKISQYMEYRDYITPEMQSRWFKKVDNIYNYYYIIQYQGKEIGLIDIRDIDYDKKCGEPGIFIWDDDYLNTDIPFRAIFALLDFGFEQLQLTNYIIHVLSDNKRAIKFNLALGYQISKNQEGIYNQEYTLEKDAYYEHRDKLSTYFL